MGDISKTSNLYDDSGKIGVLSLMSSTKISIVDGGSTSLPDLSFAKISRLKDNCFTSAQNQQNKYLMKGVSSRSIGADKKTSPFGRTEK